MLEPYLAIAITIGMVMVVATGMLVVAHLIGPRRHGPIKDSPYESGVPVAADTERRMHVRFYFVAILFLLFDVEVILIWPWATLFYHSAVEGVNVPVDVGLEAGKGFLLGGMAIFIALLLFGLLYEWLTGALKWE